jgi:2-C-methyl-D-erythritol 2,4-cyclodiphosphate synthase/2-C-methyl-D-erythritol 4-phosphate cytidylyltransferase/2-C-methyl-D-erythritol 2,4-cyclodiphosphate synthase
MPVMRIGIGRDLHRLVAGRRFVLGGVEIPAERGELGHSDGDVLIHAIIDALLGAAGLGDIGEFFPPSDNAYKDIASLELLKKTNAALKKDGWKIINIDCVVSCEKPALLPHREAIRKTLASTLETPPESIFIKGKSGEGIGDIGEGRAVEAIAVCLLER